MVGFWYVALAVALGLGCDRAASVTETTGAQEPRSNAGAPSQQATIGLTQFLSTIEVRLVSQGACGMMTNEGPSSGRTSQTYGFELELRNRSKDPVFVNPFYIHFVDAQSNVYTTTLTGCSPRLVAKRLLPREVVRGFVPFAVPNTVANGTLAVELPPMVQPMTTPRPSVRFHVELK